MATISTASSISTPSATAVPPFTVPCRASPFRTASPPPGDAPAGSGGGIRDQGNASLTLTNMVITGNTRPPTAAASRWRTPRQHPWTLTLNNSTISNNHAGDAGGGVETDGSGTDLINDRYGDHRQHLFNQGGGIWLDAITVRRQFQGSR